MNDNFSDNSSAVGRRGQRGRSHPTQRGVYILYMVIIAGRQVDLSACVSVSVTRGNDRNVAQVRVSFGCNELPARSWRHNQKKKKAS